MSEQNPYIVREEEGKAATIRDFVTGVPLKPEEMLPDEHGIHPVSPLGFLNKDGEALGVHDSTECFMPYKVDGLTPEQAYLESYVVEGKYSVFTGDAVAFPVLSMARDGNYLVVTVEETVPDNENQEFYFRNVTSDDYSSTGIPMDRGSAIGSFSIAHSASGSVIRISFSGSFSGIVGAGKLLLCVKMTQNSMTQNTKKYLCVSGNEDPQKNGIFIPGTDVEDEFRKLFNYGELIPVEMECSFDLMIAYDSGAYNYLNVMHTDGTVEPIYNSCAGSYEFRYDGAYDGRQAGDDFNHVKMVCTGLHFDHVAVSGMNPLFSTRCNHHGEWGPYLSSLENSGANKKMCVVRGPGELIELYSHDIPPKHYPLVQSAACDSTHSVPANLFPSEVEENALFYQMSDAFSYENPSDGKLYNDFYLYIYNIKYTENKCYASNGYSDREVSDWVREKLGPVIGHGKHPYSAEGRLDGAGAFTRWFASCADVDISGGAGNRQVNIPGFGLGAGYTGKCNTASYDGSIPEEGLEPGGRWLTFGYGTKHDAEQVEVGKTALPLDWPFTDVVTGVDESTENNITLSRDGVEADGTLYGRLAKYDECATCGGTGEVSGEPCPDCCGTGYAKTGTLMNRVHVCLYNDFTPTDNKNGHVDGTTVLKKTFINLAAPIDTDDGDEFEVTVSLPNVNLPDAFPVPAEPTRPADGATAEEISAYETAYAAYETACRKNQSGYYSFVSQPRVYVISGAWKFSDSKVEVDNPVTDSSVEETATVTSFDIKDAFEGIPDGTRIRATIVSSGYPSEETTFTGELSDSTVTLDCGQEVTFRRGISYTICGAAYVEENNETLPDGSTPIGLNNARRSGEGGLGPDYGNGEGIQVYNRMYGVDDEGREQVITQSDKRQVVATVYPTVTNTFAWELSGRKTLNHLDSLMTMAAEDGASSIMSRIAWMNRQILAGHQAFVDAAGPDFALTPEEYPIDMSRVTAPDSSEGYSYIASVLQVAPAVAGDDGTVNAESNPVRQALRAVGMLAEDYRNARARTGELQLGQDDSFTAEPSPVTRDWAGMFSGSTYAISGSDEDEAARSIRLRNLAPVVSGTAAKDDLTPVSPLLDMHPYVWDDGTTRTVSEFHAGNPYGYGEYASTDAVQEAPCDFVNDTYGKAYVGNSFAMACLARHPSWLDDADSRDDLLRAVEIAAVDLGQEVLSAYMEGTSPSWMQPFNAFGSLVSPDNIPVPAAGATSCDSDDDAATWYGVDAYNYYSILKGDTGSNWGLIATEMGDTEPGLSEISAFLANYVPSYGADLPVRNWDSFRVRVKRTDQVTTDPVYLARMKWYGNSCGDSFRGRYVADAFIGSDGYEDVNLNTVKMTEVARNSGATPYALGGSFDPTRGDAVEPFSTESDKGSVAYIRMFMKFTFSADAGRWYCTDYRQAPVSYLSPLYGAQSLEEEIDGKRIWTEPACPVFGWKEATRHTYGEYMPMDINPVLVEEVMTESNGMTRLMQPANAVDYGGLGLSAPYNKSGNTWLSPADRQCANFWSVRENLRPATGVLTGTYVPSYSQSGSTKTYGESGGIMSDAVLWGQYDYPAKGAPEYHLPDTEVPEVDHTQDDLPAT